MSLNIQEAQRNVVAEILSLKESDNSQSVLLWKVLILDKTSQRILAPLMKVGGLRQHGVTLNLALDAYRTAVPNVPAIYFVEPTESNLNRIIEDLKNQLYGCVYINFTSTIDQSQLEMFAEKAAAENCGSWVEKVFDRYTQFISLSPNEFTLDLKDTYYLLHGIVENATVKALVDTIVQGLLCVLVTMGGVVPIIRCPKIQQSPAYIIGNQLNNRLKEILSGPSKHLFNVSASSAYVERPCLILVDREIDLFVTVGHTWSYQTLVHDVFDYNLNRVVIPPSKEELKNESSAKPKIYDLDSDDHLWVALGPKSFPEAAVAISSAFQEYSLKKGELDRKQSSQIQTAINSLTAVPELLSQKRIIDVHTNIAHRLVSEINSRDFDKYYELENSFFTSSLVSSLSNLEKMLSSDAKGTLEDKASDQLTTTHLNNLKNLLTQNKLSYKFLDFLQQQEFLKSLQTVQITQEFPVVQPSPPQSTSWKHNLLDKSLDLIKNVRNLLPIQKKIPICETVLEVMNMDNSETEESFIYFDPKTSVSLNVSDESVPRIKAPFRQAIVFCVGGGTYVESHALQEISEKHSKQIIYGATSFVKPSDFVNELERLGS